MKTYLYHWRSAGWGKWNIARPPQPPVSKVGGACAINILGVCVLRIFIQLTYDHQIDYLTDADQERD